MILVCSDPLSSNRGCPAMLEWQAKLVCEDLERANSHPLKFDSATCLCEVSDTRDIRESENG